MAAAPGFSRLYHGRHRESESKKRILPSPTVSIRKGMSGIRQVLFHCSGGAYERRSYIDVLNVEKITINVNKPVYS